MDLRLNIDLCKKLIEVYNTHDLPSCTDLDRSNHISDRKGWVACTRCWLLNVVDTGEIPEADFKLYSTIRVPGKTIETLLGEFADLLNSVGLHDIKTKNFFRFNSGDDEFFELAEIALQLRRSIDDSE